MIKVSSEDFNKAKERCKFVPLEFHDTFKGIKSDSKFFGMEIGDNVLVVQFWNNDFCTSSFMIPRAHITTDGIKYTIILMDEHVDELRLATDSTDIGSIDDYTVEDDKADASIDQRMAAIMASNTDHENKYAVIAEEPKEPEPVVVKEEPVHTAPIITKGRQKPEESTKIPEPKSVVTRKVPTQESMPRSKPVYKPEPKPVPQADDPFAGW